MSNKFINIGSANSSPEHFQLRYISISKYEGDWQSLPHTHHFSELFYVLRGEGAFYIENEKVPVKTDDLVIINPYVEHTEKTLPNDPMEYIVFGVDGLAFSFPVQGRTIRRDTASIATALTKTVHQLRPADDAGIPRQTSRL